MIPANKSQALQDTTYGIAHDTGRKMREFIDGATHNARDTLAVTEKQIREHPVRSSAIAAGIGFLLGALFRR